jgi:hypothetical protein
MLIWRRLVWRVGGMFGGLIRDMADILKTGKKFALAEDSYFSVVRDHAHQKIFIVTNGTC